MDEVGADICITSTQKGLNIPPGLSVLFISAKLDGYKYNHKGYYWDFENNLDNLKRGQTPFSPATILFLQLHERLLQLQAQGGKQKNINEIRYRSQIFRNLCTKYDWKILADNPSSAITGFQTNDDETRKVFKGLIEKYDTYIMPGAKPGFYRVSHMGIQTENDLMALAAHIKEFL